MESQHYLGWQIDVGQIYVISNSQNDKVYVGKTTVGVEQRFKDHIKASLNPNRSFQSKLYSAMNKYGADKFTVSVIEECSDDVLNDREKYWIKRLNSIRDGYNITVGGDGYNILTDDDVARLLALWNDGFTQKEVSEKSGFNHKLVKRVLYSNGVTREEILARQFKKITPTKEKPVYVYDKDGNYITSFESCRKASRALNIHHTTIGHAIHGRGTQIHGMIFKDYKTDKINVDRFCVNKHRIYQYSLNGEFIAEYQCTRDAQKAVGLKDSHGIRNSCNSCRTSSGGYQWRYYKTDNIGMANITNLHCKNKLEADT
jgi:group I intron endonuclease